MLTAADADQENVSTLDVNERSWKLAQNGWSVFAVGERW